MDNPILLVAVYLEDLQQPINAQGFTATAVWKNTHLLDKKTCYTCFPEKYRKNHGTNKPSSLTTMIFRQKMANTSPAMLRFTAVMPAGKLVTEISWALIRCDLGSVSRIFYTSFMLPENRMYFLQVFHNIIYFFLAGGGLGSITNSNLALSFFPLLNVLTAQTYQSQMWISQDTFSTISPQRSATVQISGWKFWPKKFSPKLYLVHFWACILRLQPPFFSCFRARSLMRFNHIGYQPQRFSARLGRWKTTAERFPFFFHLGKSGLFFAKWFMPWSSMTVKAISPVLPCPKLRASPLKRKVTSQASFFFGSYVGVSKNRGTPKWMVYNGKPYKNGWFGGTTIFGNIHVSFRGGVGIFHGFSHHFLIPKTLRNATPKIQPWCGITSWVVAILAKASLSVPGHGGAMLG